MHWSSLTSVGVGREQGYGGEEMGESVLGRGELVECGTVTRRIQASVPGQPGAASGYSCLLVPPEVIFSLISGKPDSCTTGYHWVVATLDTEYTWLYCC